MTYSETLDYLFTHLPMYQRIGQAAYKKDLTNTIKLAEILGNPQNKFTSIHVAGTNGKGSVSNMLSSVLMEAGYSTGLYTSPHLLDFRERIRFNGKLCEKDFIVDFVARMQTHIEEIQPSFFEITVAMAFEYFAQRQVDIAIIEVGLGGRLDSTNIITPVLSVITNISYDHQNMLGNSLREIAGEKAGIIKAGIPVVIGEFHEETFPVFLEKSILQNSSLFAADKNVTVELIEQHNYLLKLNVSYLNQLSYPNLESDLAGKYQIKNIKTLIQAIEILRSIPIEVPDEAIYEGLKNIKRNTGFAGRWQVIDVNPIIICDCAHNTAGLKELFLQVNSMSFKRLIIVTGAVNDKDLNASLKEFPLEADYYFCTPDIPRGLSANLLQTKASEFNLKGKTFETVEKAIISAKQNAFTEDIILICGSIFVVAEALAYFEKNQPSNTSG